MPPETPKQPEDTSAQTPAAPASPDAAKFTVEPPTVVTPQVQPPTDTANTSTLPSALQPTDTAFNSLQPVKDIWRTIWRAIYGVNFGLAGLFFIFMVLSLLNAGGSEFSAGAIGTPFWILPLLIMADLVAVAVYYVVRRPKLSELKTQGTWLGVSFAAAFVAAIAYVVVQTVV